MPVPLQAHLLGGGRPDSRGLQGEGAFKPPAWGQPLHLCVSCPPAAEQPGGASLFLHSDNVNCSNNTSSEGQDGCGPSAHAQASTLLLMLVILQAFNICIAGSILWQ